MGYVTDGPECGGVKDRTRGDLILAGAVAGSERGQGGDRGLLATN